MNQALIVLFGILIVITVIYLLITKHNKEVKELALKHRKINTKFIPYERMELNEDQVVRTFFFHNQTLPSFELKNGDIKHPYKFYNQTYYLTLEELKKHFPEAYKRHQEILK